MKSKNETLIKTSSKKGPAAGADAPVRSALQVAPAASQSPAGPSQPEPNKNKPIKIASAKARAKQGRLTTVEAKIDVGFGNALFIRGQGDGLSWDKGTPLECRDAATWAWTTTKADSQIEFKLLLNDEIWAVGENLSVTPGATIETSPAFN